MGVIIILCVIVILVGVVIWNYQRYVWRCQVCNCTFRMRFKDYLSGLSFSARSRKLYCPYCKRKTKCKGERAE